MNEWERKIRLLNKMGISTKEIAATLGYSVTAVSMWMSGQTKPRNPEGVTRRLREMTSARIQTLDTESRELYDLGEHQKPLA